MFRQFAKLLLQKPVVIPLLVVPLALGKVNNFWWSNKKPNLIDNRVFVNVEVSNKPCEDRSDVLQLQAVNGYAVAVFDGHGGWQVSHFCSKQLLKKLDEVLARNKGKYSNEQELITVSLKETFFEIESNILEIARAGYKFGFGRMGRVGSCALVCVVANNKIYSANAGDSLGLIVEQDDQNRMKYVEINRELNANNSTERERLMKLFPKEDDIVICKKENFKSCYVKGRLQPTRSLGDLRLKYSEFNNPQEFSTDHDFQSKLKTFTGPYIAWQPEIQVFPLHKSYKSIILASDGLWDELQRQEVAEIFKRNPMNQMGKILINRALEKAASEANMSVQSLREIPEGKKRKLHDDITVVVVDLEGQFKN